MQKAIGDADDTQNTGSDALAVLTTRNAPAAGAFVAAYCDEALGEMERVRAGRRRAAAGGWLAAAAAAVARCVAALALAAPAGAVAVAARGALPGGRRAAWCRDASALLLTRALPGQVWADIKGMPQLSAAAEGAQEQPPAARQRARLEGAACSRLLALVGAMNTSINTRHAALGVLEQQIKVLQRAYRCLVAAVKAHLPDRGGWALPAARRVARRASPVAARCAGRACRRRCLVGPARAGVLLGPR